MKILLIGEYSNVHATLAQGLRELGHMVTVVSNGDFWKNYPRDIDVSRRVGRLGGIALMAKILALLPRLRGYDVVQLINPMFFELRAERLFSLYNYLQRHNRLVVLGAFGMDWYWVNTCTTQKPLHYSDFNIGDSTRTDKWAIKEQNDWLGTAKEQLNKHIAHDCDGIVTGLYEYHVCYQPNFPDKTRFIPFPIKPTQATAHQHVDGDGRLRIFIGINKERSEYKGTDIMLRAAEAIVAKYPNEVLLLKAESVPFAQYQTMMDGADAILDQLYSYTPSMNSLLAMSKGIIVVGGGEPENYEIINEHELRPIINVQPNYESVCQALDELVHHRERIARLQQESIDYVTRHHHYLKVAQQYETFYRELTDKQPK